MKMYKESEYISKCVKIHGDKYDYSLTKYEGSNKKVRIICKLHGEFQQLAFCHLQGQSCNKCVNDSRKKGIDDFILNCKKIHSDMYNYELVSFKNRKEKIKIVCKEHGIFEQRASDHLRGSGCKKCYRSKYKIKHDDFVYRSSMIHNNKYEYIEEYESSHKPIKIKCPNHGVFEQMPYAHIFGQGCYKCFFKSYDRTTFIEESNKIHKNSFDYNSVNYIDSKSKVDILCRKHGIFQMTPRSHLSGQSCPLCSKINISKKEVEWLDSLLIDEKSRHKTIYINKKRYFVDAIVGNTIYEFYGDYWHGNPIKYNMYDTNEINKKKFGYLYKKTIERENIMKINGYNVISIWESDFKK